MEQLGSHRADFHEIWYTSTFRKSVEKVQVSLKSDKNNETYIHLLSYLAQLFLEWETFQTKVVAKIKTHILCSIIFFNRAVYETMWKNVVEPGRPQMTIWRMRIAWCTPQATNTQSEYVILIAFSLQQWLHKNASILRSYAHCLPC